MVIKTMATKRNLRESTATRGSLRDSESLEDSETEDFSQTIGFFEEALEQADRAEPRRGTQARNVPQFFGEIRTHLAVTEGNYVEPKTVYEANQVDERNQWYRAINDEVKALQDNETWDLVRPPTDRDVIPGKWVYKVKLGPSGQVDKYKSRYVAKGFKQVEGLDYFETTCKPETFRILLQLSARQGHVMHKFDVKTAFLHSPIEEEVYLEQPQEFVKRGSHGQKLVCRLNKSIYGLKQAVNNWYKDLAKFLLSRGSPEAGIITACSQDQRQRIKPSSNLHQTFRMSGHGSSSSGSTLLETTSRGFWHPTETSNSNWRGQPKLYQTLPKPSHAQEEQAHRDKVPIHSGQDGGWDYFNSLRSYRQNGRGHLHKVLTRSESGSIQSSFDGNRLYAISSSLSGGVRISIKLSLKISEN